MIQKSIRALVLIITLSSCNLFTKEYSLVYTDEAPNEEFVLKLEKVLEESYNVDILLSKAESPMEIITQLESGNIDMGLVENLMNVGEGIHTVVPVFPKILHLFYRGEEPQSARELFENKTIYVGKKGSASYDFMMELLKHFQVKMDSVNITFEMDTADILALFCVLMNESELVNFEGFKLYSLDSNAQNKGSITDGISLLFPRVNPYVIPKNTYGELTLDPINTISTDMMYVVRKGMGKIAVNDLTKSLFEHREQFVHVHPSFYYGIIENFDRSRLSYSLHSGAKAYLNRDEPGFFERYAELVGVLFTIILALVSGVVSFGKRRKQKKKDKIDVFYASLLKIKNQIGGIKNTSSARQLIQEIKDEQGKAFKMLIDEDLEANESFRIYMQLSKETVDEIKQRVRFLNSARQE